MASALRRRAFQQTACFFGRSRHGSRGWDWYYKALEEEKEQTTLPPHTLHFRPLKPGHVRPRAFLDFATAHKNSNSNPEAETKDVTGTASEKNSRGEGEGGDGKLIGRVVLELADDIVPETVDNFVRLLDGTAPSGYSYKGTRLLNIVPNHVIMAGDVTNSKDGNDGHAAREKYILDENFVLGHPLRGIISMNNSGVDRSNSQFFITLAPSPHLDGRRVSFGRIVEGEEVLDALEQVFTLNFSPVDEIIIADCGVL